MQYYRHKAKTDEEKAIAKKKKTIVLQDGSEFVCDSEKEARYYREVLKRMLDEKVLERVDIHPTYLLLDEFDKAGVHHKREIVELDYGLQFYDEDGPYILIDVKDTYDVNKMDQVSLLKRKWFDSKFETVLRWVVYCKKFGGWISWEEYWERKKAEKKERRKLERAAEKKEKSMSCTFDE